MLERMTSVRTMGLAMVNDAQVFISYQRSDAASAQHVRAYLAQHGITTWMDQFDIPLGAYWPDAIDEGLTSSDIVVGILSPDAVASRNVKNEWDWAIANDKPLLLLRVKPCVVSHRYVSINFIEATDADLESALVTLLSAVRELQPSVEAIPATRYAKSGDLSIAYQVFGNGPRNLVITPGFVSNLDWIWNEPDMARFHRHIAEFARVVIFDKRGTGLSDRVAGVPSLEQRTDDLRAVMDAARVQRAAIMGVSQGCGMSIQFAAQYPERTSTIILYGGWAYSSRIRMLEEGSTQKRPSMYQNWGEDMRNIVAQYVPSKVDDPRYCDWFSRYCRASASPGAARSMGEMDALIDVRPLLPTLDLPHAGAASCRRPCHAYRSRSVPGGADSRSQAD